MPLVVNEKLENIRIGEARNAFGRSTRQTYLSTNNHSKPNVSGNIYLEAKKIIC
jgi:hypothetical protein